MNDRSTIEGVTLCDTVPRAAWHRSGDVWQVQAPSGLLASCRNMPRLRDPSRVVLEQSTGKWRAGPGWSVLDDTFRLGPISTPPADHTKTLRRIVDENHDERLRLCEMILADLGARS